MAEYCSPRRRNRELREGSGSQGHDGELLNVPLKSAIAGASGKLTKSYRGGEALATRDHAFPDGGKMSRAFISSKSLVVITYASLVGIDASSF